MTKGPAALARVIALPMIVALATSCGGSGGGSAGPVAIAPAPPVAPPPPPPPPAPITPAASKLTQADARVGACVNLANTLEPPNEGDWGPALRDSDIADIAAKGFRTVRFPVRFAGHQQLTPPYTIDATFMARAEHIVDIARAAGLRVILDNHNYDELMADPAGQHDRFIALWKQVAERFKGKDADVWFELMNEPNGQLTNPKITSLLADALAEIRKTNATRPVVIGGESYSGINSLRTFAAPDDDYLIATFHYYDPFAFTHQGAPWVNPVMPTGVTYGSAADATALAADVQKAKDYMASSGRPLFMGEYGEYENIPLAQRAAYYKATTDAFRAANIDGCVWGYQNSFGFRDYASGAWYQSLLTAIGL